MREEDRSKSPTELWLEEFSKEGTKRKYAKDLNDFLEWAQTTDTELVEDWEKAEDKRRWAKETGQTLVKFYNWLIRDAPVYDVGYDKERDPEGKHLHKGMSVNSARAKVTAAMSFFKSQCDRVRVKRGAFPQPKIAMGEHEFMQEELRAMFHYGDVKEKAILATAVALGWGADDFLKLAWREIEPFLGAEPFTGFWSERHKTGAVSRGHLTPEAVDSLRAWRKIAKSDVYVFANGRDKPWTNSALNYTVGQMIRKAGIKPRGKVHFHLFRKFLMRQLSNAGLNRWHIKIMVGKRVPPDILTYLQDNIDNLKTEYESAYPRFSLTRRINNNARSKITELEERVNKLTDILEKKEIEMSAQRRIIDKLEERFEKLANEVEVKIFKRIAREKGGE